MYKIKETEKRYVFTNNSDRHVWVGQLSSLFREYPNALIIKVYEL